MSREPFSADFPRPALGRTSRDIAADVGPGGASEQAFTTAPGAGELRAGDDDDDDRRVNPDALVGNKRPPGAVTAPRHPEIDPDTRLGLHPTLPSGAVETPLPSGEFPIDPPATRAVTGLAAGVAGAVPVIMIACAVLWSVNGFVPSFFLADRAVIGVHSNTIDHLFGIVAGLVGGAIWGAIFGALVKRPTLGTGVLFGFVPTIFDWLVISPASGHHLFMGFHGLTMLLPLLLNTLVWGALTGHLSGRWLRPADA